MERFRCDDAMGKKSPEEILEELWRRREERGGTIKFVCWGLFAWWWLVVGASCAAILLLSAVNFVLVDIGMPSPEWATAVEDFDLDDLVFPIIVVISHPLIYLRLFKLASESEPDNKFRARIWKFWRRYYWLLLSAFTAMWIHELATRHL